MCLVFRMRFSPPSNRILKIASLHFGASGFGVPYAIQSSSIQLVIYRLIGVCSSCVGRKHCGIFRNSVKTSTRRRSGTLNFGTCAHGSEAKCKSHPGRKPRFLFLRCHARESHFGVSTQEKLDHRCCQLLALLRAPGAGEWVAARAALRTMRNRTAHSRARLPILS